MEDVAQLSLNHKFPNYCLGTQSSPPALRTHSLSLNEGLVTELLLGKRTILWSTPLHRRAQEGGKA